MSDSPCLRTACLEDLTTHWSRTCVITDDQPSMATYCRSVRIALSRLFKAEARLRRGEP
jgi:hypothetical protein